MKMLELRWPPSACTHAPCFPLTCTSTRTVSHRPRHEPRHITDLQSALIGPSQKPHPTCSSGLAASSLSVKKHGPWLPDGSIRLTAFSKIRKLQLLSLRAPWLMARIRSLMCSASILPKVRDSGQASSCPTRGLYLSCHPSTQHQQGLTTCRRRFQARATHITRLDHNPIQVSSTHTSHHQINIPRYHKTLLLLIRTHT